MQATVYEPIAKPVDTPRSPGAGRWLLGLFVSPAVVLIAAGPAGITKLFILFGSVIVGLVLSKRNAPLYVSFVLWLWFLNPFVRRVVNYRSGWVDSDMILAASLLATFACLPRVYSHVVAGRSKGTLPFVLAIAAVSYGAVVGFFFIPPRALMVEIANWFTPILFGLFVFFEYSRNSERPGLIDAMEGTFKWALLIMGAYAVIQFTLVPAWDAMWLIQTDNPAFGLAEPFGVRVFSTMASPVPLGVAAFVGLMLLMRQQGGVSMLATVFGYISLAICSVRSAWALWATGTAIVLFRQRQRLGRFLIVSGSALLLLISSTAFAPVRDVLQKRVQTLSELGNDGSYQDRRNGYEQMSHDVLSEPLGSGLGTMETVLNQKSELGGRDSGILEILLSLGFPGSAFYFAALFMAVRAGWSGTASDNQFEVAAGAVGITVVSHMILSSITSGFDGLMLWSFAGINLAAQRNRFEHSLARISKAQQ